MLGQVVVSCKAPDTSLATRDRAMKRDRDRFETMLAPQVAVDLADG